MTLPPLPTHDDHWISTPHGPLFARRWTPPGAEAAGRAPVVLFHESLGCVSLWRDFPAALAQATGREVIAYDRLGFGQSAAHPGTLPASFVVDEAREGFAALREALGLRRFVALGHSVGGGMALGAATAWADDCEALVLESAQAFVEPMTLAGIRAADADFAQPGQMARLARHHGDKAPWVLRAWVDTWLSEAFVGWNLDALLPRLRCPLLVLHGEQDEYGSPAQAQRFVALAGGPSTLQLLPGCGHVPHRQQLPAVLAALSRFLGEVTPGGVRG